MICMACDQSFPLEPVPDADPYTYRMAGHVMTWDERGATCENNQEGRYKPQTFKVTL